MRSSSAVYDALAEVVSSLGLTPHRTARRALSRRLAALLCGQSLAPAELARALPSPTLVPARARYQAVARTWTCPWLTPAWLTPVLLRAALALAAPTGQPLLVLDSVRCGGWEVFTVGLVWHRRTLLVGWAVLPYPWPKKRFTPTVCGLLTQVAAAWPKTAARPKLVADRGFPSYAFFATLTALGWDYAIRLRASDWVVVDGERQPVRRLLGDAVPEQWQVYAGQYGTARGPVGQVVVGQGVLVVPWHQRDAGSARARAHRARRRQAELLGKHARRAPSRASATDSWVVLFTSDGQALAPVRAYAHRWAIEGTYRDGQSGWDGRHGWNLEPTLAQATSAAQVDGIVGLWALGLLLQSWVGDRIGQPQAPAAVQAVGRQWTVHGRLSVWARGRFAFGDGSGELDDWLVQTLRAAAHRLDTTAPLAARPRPRPVTAPACPMPQAA